jgi:cation diffusion facilitator CzcD-associated flavoprotein CzcO
MPSSKTRLAIIGGGVAGLVVARHATSRPEIYSVSLFEQTDQIGGTWVYTDETETDRNGLLVHSSMYKNLRWVFPLDRGPHPVAHRYSSTLSCDVNGGLPTAVH